MPRINIEDSLLRDDRFADLIVKSGSRVMALGIVCEAFIVAQKFFIKSSDRLIPLNEWQRKKELHVLVDVDLVEIRDGGAYIRGSEEQFKWVLQRQAAGKSSAESKRIKRTMGSTVVQRNSTGLNGSQPLTLTLTQTKELLPTSGDDKFKKIIDPMEYMKQSSKEYTDTLSRFKLQHQLRSDLGKIKELWPTHDDFKKQIEDWINSEKVKDLQITDTAMRSWIFACIAKAIGKRP